MITKLSSALVAILLAVTVAVAQEIKVDFNANNRPVSEGWDTAYTSWNTNSLWFPGGDVISNTFSGVTFTFRRVGPTGSALRPDRYALGLTTAGWNAKLVSDGIQVEPPHITNVVGSGQSPARIELTISNLPAGPHTLLTWHNTWQNPSPYTFSPLNIYVNGVQVITNLPVSNRVTNNADAAYSYVSFVADGGANVTVVAYEASVDFNVTDANPCIDGFELNTPNFKFKANKPSPANGDEHVDADATKNVLLYWTKAAIAVTNRIYFGTSSNAVYSATLASLEFKGNQTATNLLVTNLSSLATYYWRVDQIDSTNGVTKGDLWMFRTRHLAFPGAEGYGRFARGGRGGVVVVVTNLNDSGPGSFRDAVTGNYGPRTIVFDVSGLITLQSRLVLNSPYITVAGQTAPGKGICLKKWTMGLSGASDAIVRFIRSRPGRTLQTITVDEYSDGTPGTPVSATAAVSVDGMGMQGSTHSILDHCSISWTIDEAFSSRSAKNITLQRTLISEALNKALHPNYIFLDNLAGAEHGYAASVGGDVGSFHHNLLAHCYGRNWSMAGGLDAANYFAGRLDFNNNVVYNWGSRTTDGGAMEVDFVANYYKPGPGTTLVPYALTMNHEDNFAGSQRCCFTNNVMPGYFDESNQTVGRRSVVSGGVPVPTYETFVATPFFPSHVTTQTALGAYKQVLSDIGCNLPFFDDHDARIIRETLNGNHTYTGSVTGKKGFPDVETDVGGWEDYGTATRLADWDTDNDGLPNWWEQIKGLNANSAPGDFSDSNGDPDGDEYTNLEDYLNWLALPHFDCTNSTPIDIDLTQFTRGYTNNTPVYFVSVPTNGTVTLIGNNRTARFTPSVITNALGSFRFSVVDAQGYSLTNTVNLRLISAVAPAQPPVLGIRHQNNRVQIELTGETGRGLTVQTKTNLGNIWLEWTNVTGIGTVQLLPLNSLTNQSLRYFRAFAQ